MPLLDLPFTEGYLYQIRSTVAAHASQAQLSTALIDELVLIASELVINTVRHGGGAGQLSMWTDRGHVYLQVADSGPGMPNPGTAGCEQPAPGEEHGRGLWVVRTLSAQLTITSGEDGTTVLAALPIRTRL